MALTSRYGSFVLFGVSASGMNGGLPAVEKNTAGIGWDIPYANSVSEANVSLVNALRYQHAPRSASIPGMD